MRPVKAVAIGGGVVVALASLAAMFLIRSTYVGDVHICEPDLLRENVARSFDQSAWMDSPTERLAMIESLSKSQSFRGTAPSQIEELLGTSDCYVGYEDEPCYRVPVRDADDQYLAFGVAHSGPDLGKVIYAKLDSEPFSPFCS